jgi:hypothetical protein
MNQPPQSNAIGSALSKIEPLLRSTWVRSRPTLLATLKSLVGLGQEAATALEKQIAADSTSPAPLNFTPVQKAATTFWEKVQPWWVKIIAGVRSRLDGETNAKLSDRAISGIFAGLALLLLWLTTSLPLGHSQPMATNRQPSVASRPKPAVKLAPKSVAQTYPADVTNKTAFPKELTTAPTSATSAAPALTAKPPMVFDRPEVIAPAQTAPAQTAPAQTAPAQTASAQTASAQTAPAQITPATAPAIATAPPIPIKPIAPKTITAPPKPINKPTPEQQLLTSFQGLSNSYAPNLVQTAQQDKLANTLRLTLADGWYGLEADQQEKLATELLGKTQTLKVRSLQLLDKQGNLLARNPIVGNEMILLLRQLAVE